MGEADFEFLRNILASSEPLPSRPTSLLSDMMKAENLARLSSLNYIGSLFAPKPEAKQYGITFARDGGDNVRFSEPIHLGGLPQPPRAGLYVILVADNSWTPRSYRPLYFGETENLAERPTTSHERYEDWCTAAAGIGNVRVAYCWMIGSRKDERTAIESDLIKFYKPECNIAYNSFAWWLSRTTPVAPGIPGGYGSLLDMLGRTKLT